MQDALAEADEVLRVIKEAQQYADEAYARRATVRANPTGLYARLGAAVEQSKATRKAVLAAYAAALLRAMATGLYSFFVFCLVLAVALPHVGISGSFATALAMSLAVQTLTGQHLSGRSRRRPAPAPEL